VTPGGAAADLPAAGAVLSKGEHATLEAWRAAGDVIVFTNGVFDLLHRGHLDLLERSRALGDRLVVGVNGDASVRRLKGSGRPLVLATERTAMLAALRCVDMTVIFDDDTPERLIREVKPHVLVKGGDWPVERIVGRAFVEAHGGRVLSLPLREGYGTSNIVERIRAGRSALDP